MADAPKPEPVYTRTLFGHRRLQTSIAGEDLGRIIALSDGVFAFALTLLVLSLAVPSIAVVHTNGQLGASLNQDLPTFFGYAFAFVMIGVWWIVHNRTYQYIVRFDSALVWLNMALLAQIAVMPFVLSVYTTYANNPYNFRYAVDLFAALQITLGITTTSLWLYARRAGLTKPDLPEQVSHYFVRRGYLTAAVFALSIGIAFYRVDWAQYSWVLIFVVQRLLTISGD
ncbi:MAG TPA: TMEM175 family protein [Thermoplasmata archaeon]|nr:TMEM175 family protein [Thermoplasmata archaeon]